MALKYKLEGSEQWQEINSPLASMLLSQHSMFFHVNTTSSQVSFEYATKPLLSVIMFTFYIAPVLAISIAYLVSILCLKYWLWLLKWAERWNRMNVYHWLRQAKTYRWGTYLQTGDEINNWDKLLFGTQCRCELIVRLVFSFPCRYKLSTLD